ncbi:MAG: heavy metal translocating P-type ATPase [Actinomycetota bacterium]
MNPLAGGRRIVLPLVVALVATGIGGRLTGWSEIADWLLVVAIGVVTGLLVTSTVARLREGRIAVDVVALLALIGALAFGELVAGAVVALMVASGEALEGRAQRRARRELSALVSLAPKLAHRRSGSGYEDVPAAEVLVGDLLMVKPSEVVPVDGIACEPALLDQSVLTGEAEPVERAPDQVVRSGSINAGGAFAMRAAATEADSAYAGIVELVRSAGVDRSPFVRLADRYAMLFVPVVLVVTIGAWLVSGDSTRALAVLVVATPCPLVLAAPVAIVSGISGAARHGVVVKDGRALEAMAEIRTLLLDKTGTLTRGRPRVVSTIAAPGSDTAEVVRLAAAIEQASSHVLAGAIVAAARSHRLLLPEPSAFVERPGAGVSGIVRGVRVDVGSPRAVTSGPLPQWFTAGQRRARRRGCSTVAVVVDGSPIGLILLADELRTDTPRALRALRRAGVDRIVMVTGDRLEVAEPIGRAVGLDEVYADRTPAGKLDVVRLESRDRPGGVAMVGDGVNDAPALAAADLGVAVAGRGATASSEAADAILVVDRLDRLATAVVTARRARAVARQSVLLGMGLSFVGMAAAAVGLMPPVIGAIAQEVIDVVAIGNALRARRDPPSGRAPTEVPDAWVRQLATEHGPLRLLVDDLQAGAAALLDLDGRDGLRSLRRLLDRLRSELEPHERLDEAEIYPSISEGMPGDDPLAPLSRTHQEIFHLISVLDRLAGEADGELDAEDRVEAQRLLYALGAILRLHFAQEEELLSSLR